MRGKRAKRYRKLMQQYGLTFGFREPYQVLLDAQIVQDAHAFHMDLPGLLENALHGKVKPMITHCSIRHLRALPQPLASTLIQISKNYELRRCGHHELETPNSTSDCLLETVAGKSGSNKHRYVVATQDLDTRKLLREVPGTPLLHVTRSVLVMEPMSDSTIRVKLGVEKDKVRSGLKGSRILGKRKREEDDADGDAADKTGKAPRAEDARSKQRKFKAKGPNSLSVKKKTPKKSDAEQDSLRRAMQLATQRDPQTERKVVIAENESSGNVVKKKRRRKHKAKIAAEEDGELASNASGA